MKTYSSLNKVTEKVKVGEKIKIENPYMNGTYRRLDKRSRLSLKRASNGDNAQWYQEHAVIRGA